MVCALMKPAVLRRRQIDKSVNGSSGSCKCSQGNAGGVGVERGNEHSKAVRVLLVRAQRSPGQGQGQQVEHVLAGKGRAAKRLHLAVGLSPRFDDLLRAL